MRQTPLRLMLIVPFALQIVGAVRPAGYFPLQMDKKPLQKWQNRWVGVCQKIPATAAAFVKNRNYPAQTFQVFKTWKVFCKIQSVTAASPLKEWQS